MGGVLVVASTTWAQGYRLEQNRLSIAADQWQEWRFPQGNLGAEVSHEGENGSSRIWGHGNGQPIVGELDMGGEQPVCGLVF